MVITKARLKSILPWLLLVLGLFWVVQPNNPFYAPTEKPEPLIDAYMTNATATRYNPDGSIKERLNMANWEHVLESQSTEMYDLRLELFRADGSMWKILSDEGSGYHPSLSAQIEYVLLRKNVLVSHMSGRQLLPEWNLSTDELTVYPDYAQTDLPVTLLGPDNARVDAIGLKAYLETGYVEFLDQVKTQYNLQKAL